MKKRLIILLSFTLSICCFTSCTEDMPTEPEPTLETIIPESTKPVSSDDFTKNLVGFSNDSSVITMNKNGMKNYNVSENDILFLPTENGLLRKVTSVATDGDNVVIKTEQGTLEDAVERGSSTFNENILSNGLGTTIFKMPGVQERITILEKTNEPQLNINAEIILYESDKDTSTTFDQVKLGIEYNNSTDFYGEININGFTLNKLNLGYKVTENTIISLRMGRAVPNLSLDTIIYKKTFKPFTIWMGSLPVVVVPELEIKAGIEAEIGYAVTYGTSLETTKNTGIRYENGDWSTFKDIERNSWTPFSDFDGGVSVKAFVTTELQFKVYNVVSPYLSLEGYAKAKYEIPDYYAISSGIDIKAGVKAKIWKREIFNFNTEIYSNEWIIKDGYLTNQAPTADFNVNPQNGTTNTIFNFDASGCHDREDPDENLNVRWDWEGDGIWDTPFSNIKTATHQYSDTGLYEPKLEVIDSKEETDDSSKIVGVDPIVLVAYYPFNNNTEDESRNGHDGIPYGIGFVKDRFGNDNKACTFDGINNYIEIFDASSLNFESDFSLCYWEKTSAEVPGPTIFKRSSENSTGYSMYNDEDGTAGLDIRNNNGEYSRVIAFNQGLNDGKWHFIVGIRRVDSLEIWVDGMHVNSVSCITSDLNNSANLLLGRSNYQSSSYYYKGDLDDIRMFNYALSNSKILDLYHEMIWPAKSW